MPLRSPFVFSTAAAATAVTVVVVVQSLYTTTITTITTIYYTTTNITLRCRPFPRLFPLLYYYICITLSILSSLCRVPLGGHPSARVCLSKPPPPPFFESVQQQYIILLGPVTRRRRGYTGCYTNLSTRLSCPSATEISIVSSSTMITANINAV